MIRYALALALVAIVNLAGYVLALPLWISLFGSVAAVLVADRLLGPELHDGEHGQDHDPADGDRCCDDPRH